MVQRKFQGTSVKYMLAGGSVVAALGLLVDLRQFLPATASAGAGDGCEAMVQPKADLSRSELSTLLTIPERAPKAKVREILAQPFCTLPSLQIRSGVTAQREAYPLAFDPHTWFIVLYEGDEYAGYSFSFQRP